MEKSFEKSLSPPPRSHRGFNYGLLFTLGPALLAIPTHEILNRVLTSFYSAAVLGSSTIDAVSELAGLFLLLRYIVKTRDGELRAAVALFILSVGILVLCTAMGGIDYILTN
jgi:hypothetical protein